MNDQLLFNDGIRVYANFKINVKSWIRIILISLNVIIYGGVIGVLITLDNEHVNDIILPALGFLGMIFFTLTYTTFWNVMGKETVIITTKAISHQRDYGLFRTNMVSIEIPDGFTMAFERMASDTDAEEYGVIIFYKLNKYNLEEPVYSTSIKTTKNNYQQLNKLVDELYEFENKDVLEGISLN